MNRLPLAVLVVAFAAAGSLADDFGSVGGSVHFTKSSGSSNGGGGASAGGGSVPGKKLDLSGLLAGPKGPSPTLDDAPPDNPNLPAFRAAVDYIAGDGLSIAKAAFAKYLERNAMAGGTEGPQDADFKTAHDLITQLLKARSDAPRHLTIASMSARDAGSAYWQLDPYHNGDPFPGGTVGLGARPKDEINASGSGDMSYYRLKKIDDWTNGVLHEALHVYFSVFTFSGFKAKETQDEWPICFGQTVFAMGASPTMVCSGNRCPQPYKQYQGKACYRPCGDTTCYSWAIPGKDAEGPTEIIARQASLDMTESSHGEALRKIAVASN